MWRDSPESRGRNKHIRPRSLSQCPHQTKVVRMWRDSPESRGWSKHIRPRSHRQWPHQNKWSQPNEVYHSAKPPKPPMKPGWTIGLSAGAGIGFAVGCAYTTHATQASHATFATTLAWCGHWYWLRGRMCLYHPRDSGESRHIRHNIGLVRALVLASRVGVLIPTTPLRRANGAAEGLMKDRAGALAAPEARLLF